MQKIRVFLNQQASQSAERDWKKLIHERLFRSQIEFINPKSHEEFMEELDRAAQDQIDIIVSVGGDGTIHSLIQKLAHKNIPFLVLPAGTANDLANSLGVAKMRIHEILSIVREGTPKKIDLIDINGTLMATNGGIGFVADVAAKVNRFRKNVYGFKELMAIAKQETYAAVIVSTIIRNQFQYYNVRVSSKEYSGEIRTPLLMINNQPKIAGSFPVAPNTKHDDGKFNVTIFLHQRISEFVTSIYRIRKGISPENDPLILSFETDAISVESTDGKKLEFMGDGERLVKSNRLDVKIRPQSIQVFAEVVEQIQLSDYSEEGKASE